MHKTRPHRGVTSLPQAVRKRPGAAGVFLFLAIFVALGARGQQAGPAHSSALASPYRELKDWYGSPVRAVRFEGVSEQDLNGLRQKLAVHPGSKLSERDIQDSLRVLFASGLYRNIVAEGI